MAHTISWLTTQDTNALHAMLVAQDIILVGISIFALVQLRRVPGKHAVRGGHGRRRSGDLNGHRR